MPRMPYAAEAAEAYRSGDECLSCIWQLLVFWERGRSLISIIMPIVVGVVVSIVITLTIVIVVAASVLNLSKMMSDMTFNQDDVM